MFPVFKLVGAHVKPAAFYFTETNITAANFKFTFRKAHRLTSIAATTTLVKHQRTMKAF